MGKLAIRNFTLLGQNFAKAFGTIYRSERKRDYVWATSWGVSTRLMGALIMSHSDDNGLVIPPRLAPYQVVIVPIYRNMEQLQQINEKVKGIRERLKSLVSALSTIMPITRNRLEIFRV